MQHPALSTPAPGSLQGKRRPSGSATTARRPPDVTTLRPRGEVEAPKGARDKDADAADPAEMRVPPVAGAGLPGAALTAEPAPPPRLPRSQPSRSTRDGMVCTPNSSRRRCTRSLSW